MRCTPPISGFSPASIKKANTRERTLCSVISFNVHKRLANFIQTILNYYKVAFPWTQFLLGIGSVVSQGWSLDPVHPEFPPQAPPLPGFCLSTLGGGDLTPRDNTELKSLL